jgi:hypothetical protein
MPEMSSHEIESMRRSVAMVTAGQPCGLSRETALDVLRQLQEITAERDLLREGRDERTRAT